MPLSQKLSCHNPKFFTHPNSMTEIQTDAISKGFVYAPFLEMMVLLPWETFTKFWLTYFLHSPHWSVGVVQHLHYIVHIWCLSRIVWFRFTFFIYFIFWNNIDQECILVGCVTPARYRMGVPLWTETSPGQRNPPSPGGHLPFNVRKFHSFMSQFLGSCALPQYVYPGVHGSVCIWQRCVYCWLV